MKTDEIMTSFMNYMYSTLTDGKEEFDRRNAQERFITWCLPGIPIDPSELRFARRGLVGEGATPEERERDARLLLRQAGGFARLADFVPEMTGIFGEEQQLVAFHKNEDAMSKIYLETLTQSQVPRTELTAEDEQQIDRIQKFLWRVIEEEDFDGNKTVRMVPSPAMKAYEEFKAKFDAAFDKFNRARSDMVKEIPGATDTFSSTGARLREDVMTALAQWETGGGKSQIEARLEEIAQRTRRSLVLWKKRLNENFLACRKTDDFGDFFMTTLLPGNFAGDEAGFAQREFTESHVSKHADGSSTQFSATLGVDLPLKKFSLAGEGGFTKDTRHTLDTLSEVKISFKVAQIPLSRPWFDPTFINSRAWRLPPDAFQVGELSDGGNPEQGIAPKGRLAAYPTSVIFVRDVVVSAKELRDEMTEIKKTIEAGGSVGWGPFKLGGKYKRADQSFDQKGDLTADGFRVSGLQIMGFRCHLLHKAPDPLDTITDWI